MSLLGRCTLSCPFHQDWKPICLFGTLSIPVSYAGKAVLLVDMELQTAVSVFMANHRALVRSGQYDDRVRSLRWADAVTLARASEALEHSHQRQGCVASGQSPEPGSR
jgi:hypothetical protein